MEFLKQHKKVILKPDLGSLGRGIEIIEYTNEDAARKRFKEFSLDSPTICEEYIRQHPSLNEMNPFSVNTVRVVTILDNNNVEIIAAVLKTGGSVDKFVDNMHNGGIGAQVDIQTGIVTTHGRNYQFKSYVCHPISGMQFIGYCIPNWEKVTELAKEAHRRLPQCLIYGWDIAVTENGAEIIEANNAPGPLLMQTMDRVPKGKKVIKMMKTIKIPQKYSKSDTYEPEYNF